MTKARALREMGVEVDAPYLGAWASRIGSFILNFGGIEILSYQQLLILEASHDDFLKNLDRLFAKRSARLKILLADTKLLSDPERTKAQELWEEADELATWRNRIAHNPVLPTWKPGSNADTDPPDLLGLPDFRQLKVGPTSDSIPAEVLDQMIKHSASLAQRLHSLSVRLRGEA